MEPGRSIVGPTGVLITQVLYTKVQGEQPFAITDAGMTDLIRPALYQAHHPIVPVRPRPGTVTPIHLVGPVCETSDVLATARPLSPLNAGDYLAVLQAGAYGYAMSSNYNGRLRPAEIMVKGAEWQVIRGREQYHHLLPQP
jgi:diaminopimelate decarboxylase